MTNPYKYPFRTLLLCVSLAALSGCNLDDLSGKADTAPPVTFSTEYQAIFLDNGAVYFGKLENPESTYPLLRNVFYVQNKPNEETKEIVNLLVKRGKEWHGPDVMYLNRQHIVMVEPVAAESQVGKLIYEANEKTGQ